MKLSLKQSSTAAQDYGEYTSGSYACVLEDMKVVESKFKDDKDGEQKYQVQVTWKVNQLTAEQQDEGLEPGKWFTQWVSLYYGVKKDGTPSALKALFDSIAEDIGWDLSDGEELDLDEFITAALEHGIKRQVLVTGPNDKGYFKVVSAERPRSKRKAQPAAQAEPAPPQRTKPSTRVNAPKPAVDEDEEVF
jgi:hypothetical protein